MTISRRRFQAAVLGMAGMVLSPWGRLGPTPTRAEEDCADRPIKVLLIGKDRDHPPGTHEYMDECRMLAACLTRIEGVEAVVSNGWPTDPAILDGVSTIFLYTAVGGDVLFKDPARRVEMQRLLDRGCGLVSIHWSTGVSDGEPAEAQLAALGGTFDTSYSKLKFATAILRKVDPDHPIGRGWNDFEMHDEFYLELKYAQGIRPLIAVELDGVTHTLGWTLERPNGGRSFGFVCGHFHENFVNDNYRGILLNAILWTAGREVPAEGAPKAVTAEELTLSPDPRRGTK
ncbi:hypothetical protein Isop_1874 [Isosphaera pallida ATCC 43644]|uniref:ThuA-like domain-containing protein n=1 Tax=Isosphaera pallida (strain ATCC 43644 / DSM 9630 / IS1B) TaxID=575540 RepID=E8R223_ISOPI|nr:ThuA domain-containing protein [Isosphaera pallida]ADV62455.1 hypothetical protein Isop_1874 [Isosphaera pallida ATCC 43644]